MRQCMWWTVKYFCFPLRFHLPLSFSSVVELPRLTKNQTVTEDISLTISKWSEAEFGWHTTRKQKKKNWSKTQKNGLLCPQRIQNCTLRLLWPKLNYAKTKTVPQNITHWLKKKKKLNLSTTDPFLSQYCSFKFIIPSIHIVCNWLLLLLQ